MEEAFDNDPTPAPELVHAGCTIEQAHAHFNDVMEEEQPTPLVEAFLLALEDQHITSPSLRIIGWRRGKPTASSRMVHLLPLTLLCMPSYPLC